VIRSLRESEGNAKMPARIPVLEFGADVLGRWDAIAKTQDLDTPTQTAIFLLEQ